MRWIDEAVVDGARLKVACETICISYRTYRRWASGKLSDGRKGAPKSVPRRLSQEERDRFYDIANTPEYRDQTPGQIVASLLEKGIYIGSERTLYRILKDHHALVSRTRTRKPVRHAKPPERIATGPDQIWTWDITWLKTDVKGLFLYGYVIIDIFSRRIVGWSVENTESPDHAKALFERVIRNQKVAPQFVHSDNGGPMKGLTLVAFLTQMKVGLSFSRPRVSDDNPYIESFFGTLKSNVRFPSHFLSLSHARDWLASFIHWYNTEHRHSGIGYVTPHQKHTGQDIQIFKTRQLTLDKAYAANPQRFVCGPRTVLPDRTVFLNKAA